MRILVTGGAGFIGSHLVPRLMQSGHEVITLDSNPLGTWAGSERICRDCRALYTERDLPQLDFVYHLASTVGVSRVLANPKECIENIIESTRAVLSLGVPGIYFSTSEVYGMHPGTEKLSEESPLIWSSKTRWTYAGAKLIGEWLALAAGWKVVRLFNVIGPRQASHYGAVVPNFIRQAQSGVPLTVYGDGTQVRTFMDVNDCVDILDQLRDKQFEIVNVGGVHTLPIAELAQIVRSLVNRKVPIAYVPYRVVYARGFEECPGRLPDLGKLQSLIGTTEYTPLADTIEEIAGYGIRKQREVSEVRGAHQPV